MGVSRLIQSGDAVEPNEFEFEYTGDYNFKDGAGGTIEIEFLTSGTFKLLKSTPFKPFDLCLVGGGGSGGKAYTLSGYAQAGGGGGGGGYVENIFDAPIELNKEYALVIGGSNGDTTGFGYTAKAGTSGENGTSGYNIEGKTAGGSGGSGGGACGFAGGSNGSDGLGLAGGYGQRTTTRAFASGKILGGGGGGGYSNSDVPNAGAGGVGGGGNGGASGTAGTAGDINTGGGGGGGGASGKTGGAGGSGIIILRRRWDSGLAINNNYAYNYITNNITTA